MSQLPSAERALFAGDLERAKSLAIQSFDQSPGLAALLLGHVALEEGEFQRAEMLARTALENFVHGGSAILADALGQQGRRAEAETVALQAISTQPDSGLLRAVLGEQRVRQAKWDLGTQDFVDALSLNDRPYVVRHLWRVLGDLANGHRAGKVPAARAQAFISRIESGAPRTDGTLVSMLSAAKMAIEQGIGLPAQVPRAPAAHSPPPAARESRGPAPAAPPPQPARPAAQNLANVPALVAVMRRDRSLNEALQEGLGDLGLPAWPSKHTTALDTIEAMRPAPLQIDREEFQREHLNVTSGSVASEIVIERALQELLSPSALGTHQPTMNQTGLTQLEIALWDGVLSKTSKISPVYLADVPASDQNVLALGAFLGSCVVYPGVATWSFDANPTKSSIETVHGDLYPFQKAEAWISAQDKDDVWLEEFVAEAEATTGHEAVTFPKHDTTIGLQGTPLTMRLAELWMGFRAHLPSISQNEVARTIRPLVNTEDLIIFAIAREFTPPIRPGSKRKETAVAFVRATGEFLLLESRKHFARAAGLYCKKLSYQSSARALDLFSMYHRPGAKVFGPNNGPVRPEVRKGRALLQFNATVDGEEHRYALVNAPEDYIEWSLLEVD